ncbi:MAG: hypothetical protein ACRDTC_17000 [Pseudonocardiaceae bacterium]
MLVAGVDAPPVDGAAPPAPVDEDVGCVPSSAFDAGSQHIQFAHLQTSPGQQVTDLLSLDQYVKTHTVLVGDMVKPHTDYLAC